MQVCLASTSPARLMLMRQVGIEPQLASPGVDEDAAVAAREQALGRVLSPGEHVQFLAKEKAKAVAVSLADDFEGLVIGGDSMFELDGRVYGKPHTPERAAERWRMMRGKTGILHSGHSVIRIDDGSLTRADATAEARVTFVSDITDDEIDAYVATGEPLAVAGAFTVDSLGGAFIERVEGDPSTVVGMSLSTIRRLARELGVEWTGLWSTSS